MKLLLSTHSAVKAPSGLFQTLILIVLLLSTWLRLWRLTSAPPGFYADEAYNAMDTIWMLDSHSFPIFFPGNNGREPMFLYLVAFVFSVLGAIPFTIRLTSVFIGLLTIALVYRWVSRLFAERPDHRWLALFTAAGLANSFWHVLVSRTGFRAILTPFFVMLITYWLWVGWQKRSWSYLALAGMALGLSQYTYLSARLLPLALLLFTVAWTFLRSHPTTGAATSPGARPNRVADFIALKHCSDIQALWLGLIVLALVSVIVSLPLGLFYLTNLTVFSMRTDQVFVWNEIARGKVTLPGHILNALNIFGTGRDAFWRLGLLGRLSFGWLNVGLFWLGLLVVIRHLRRPAYVIVAIILWVSWLPALLSTPPPEHPLHLLGMLPAYYTITALGALALALFLSRWQRLAGWSHSLKLSLFALILIINSQSTTVAYFTHWAPAPEVYDKYNGPLINVTRYLITQSHTTDILIPFRFYAQPTTRFLLSQEFQETDPLAAISSPSERPVIFVDAKPDLNEKLADVQSKAYVWLTRDKSGLGRAYVSRQPPPAGFSLTPTAASQPVLDPRTGNLVALVTPLESLAPALPLFTDWPPCNTVNYNWNQQFQLVCYQLTPNDELHGSTLNITLYWQFLADSGSDTYEIEVEIKDKQTGHISQTRISAEELFRWRKRGAVISTTSTLPINSEAEPDAYEVQIKLFNRNREVMPTYTVWVE
jgi:hypothetical protein